MPNLRTAIVIPTYNESENIRQLVEAIKRTGLGARIVIVDDNSPDGTGQVAAELAAHLEGILVVNRQRREGYGRALTAGIQHALRTLPGLEAVISMDADFSHQPRYLPALLSELAAFDVVIGSRYTEGGGVANWGLHRRLLSRFGNLYTKWVTGLSLQDCTSGFVGYRRHVIEALQLETLGAQGYSFLIELKFRVAQRGFSIKEIPITFVERERGTSKMHLGIAAEALALAWRLRKSRTAP